MPDSKMRRLEAPLFDAAMALRIHFESISGEKEARATKLLAMKRPALFPVIDDRVVKLYKVAASNESVSLTQPPLRSATTF